jgi:hypothetical protein
MKHACEVFGIPFNLGLQPVNDAGHALHMFQLTKFEIETKQIDLLKQRMENKATIELDDTWRAKIHAYVAHIRPIIEKAPISQGLRDSILEKLNGLAKEIDRSRTRVRVFGDLLIEVCGAMGTAAKEMKPVVALLEKIVGAVVRLHGVEHPLALPPPEEFGLDASEPVAPHPSETDTREA